MAKEAAGKATETALQSPDVEDKKKKDDGKAKKESGKAKNPNKLGLFKRIGRFFKDLKSEFKKIVWPTKKQILNNTAVVLTVMLIVGVCIWVLDYGFINLFRVLFQ